ncbi:MAG TPA: AarF/ABC1/UbiB kinase family protein [Verrucomicrobiales bacterium]|nr:AarF/ABC1/UbiB kinase family protein [Verrucomicrobiales bacterium]
MHRNLLGNFGYRALRLTRLSLLTLGFLSSYLYQRCIYSRRAFEESVAKLLRRYLQRSGGALLKAGQLLSVRLDLITPGLEKELRNLLDQAEPVDFGDIQKTILEDLNIQGLSEAFRKFDASPQASASVAQVHRAELRTSGETVAVKVVRPEVERVFDADLFFISCLARSAAFLGCFKSYNIRAFVDELSRLIRRELNFIHEAAYLEELRKLMIEDGVDHYAPKLFAQYSTRRVMTMEWVSGCAVKDLLALVEGPPSEERDKGLQELARQNISPRRTARLIFRSLIEQSCRYRLFHADPHHANMIVQPGGRLAYIDFGMVGFLDEFAWEKLCKLFKHMAFHNVHGTYEALMATVEPLPPIDPRPLESEIKSLVADWVTASKSSTATMIEKSNGRLLMKAVDAMRRNRILFPWAIMALFRSTIVSDLTVYRLDPAFDATEELRDFFDCQSRRRLRHALSFGAWQRAAYTLVESAGALPQAVEEVSGWTRTRLPALGRSFGQKHTRLERGISKGLQYLSTVFFLGGSAVLLVKVLASIRLISPGVLAEGYWIPAGLALLFLAHGAGRIAGCMDQP